MAIGLELWKLIEGAQGYSYLSDAQTEIEPDDAKVLRDAEMSLQCHRECVRILCAFINRHKKRKAIG